MAKKKGIPPDRRGRPEKARWSKLAIGEGRPASSGTAHYQNRMATGARHYVFRTVGGTGYVFRDA